MPVFTIHSLFISLVSLHYFLKRVVVFLHHLDLFLHLSNLCLLHIGLHALQMQLLLQLLRFPSQLLPLLLVANLQPCQFLLQEGYACLLRSYLLSHEALFVPEIGGLCGLQRTQRRYTLPQWQVAIEDGSVFLVVVSHQVCVVVSILETEQ